MAKYPNVLTMDKPLQVVVGVVQNFKGQILLARRQQQTHLAGYWEFPGGKIEANETAAAALARELLEEVNVQVLAAKPLQHIVHRYPEKTVALDFWLVSQFYGVAHGREGQEIRWVDIHQLHDYSLPPANAEIVAGLLTSLI